MVGMSNDEIIFELAAYFHMSRFICINVPFSGIFLLHFDDFLKNWAKILQANSWRSCLDLPDVGNYLFSSGKKVQQGW